MRDDAIGGAASRGSSKSIVLRKLRSCVVVALLTLGACAYMAWAPGAPGQLAMAAPGAQAAPRAPAQPAAVTGQRCLRCHREVVTAYGELAHGKAAAFLKDSRTVTCETCHGDGTAHIES